jgi:hypothetical protein
VFGPLRDLKSKRAERKEADGARPAAGFRLDSPRPLCANLSLLNGIPMMNRQADRDLSSVPANAADAARDAVRGWCGFAHHHAVS